MKQVFLKNKKIIVVIIFVIITIYALPKFYIFLSGGCKTGRDCYLCYGLSSKTSPDFSIKKYNQIKLGMSVSEIDKILGKPLTIDTFSYTYNKDTVTLSKIYSNEKENSIFLFANAAILSFNKNNKLIYKRIQVVD